MSVAFFEYRWISLEQYATVMYIPYYKKNDCALYSHISSTRIIFSNFLHHQCVGMEFVTFEVFFNSMVDEMPYSTLLLRMLIIVVY